MLCSQHSNRICSNKPRSPPWRLDFEQNSNSFLRTPQEEDWFRFAKVDSINVAESSEKSTVEATRRLIMAILQSQKIVLPILSDKATLECRKDLYEKTASLGTKLRAEVAQPGRALDSLLSQWGRSWRPSRRRFKPGPRHQITLIWGHFAILGLNYNIMCALQWGYWDMKKGTFLLIDFVGKNNIMVEENNTA